MGRGGGGKEVKREGEGACSSLDSEKSNCKQNETSKDAADHPEPQSCILTVLTSKAKQRTRRWV